MMRILRWTVALAVVAAAGVAVVVAATPGNAGADPPYHAFVIDVPEQSWAGPPAKDYVGTQENGLNVRASISGTGVSVAATGVGSDGLIGGFHPPLGQPLTIGTYATLIVADDTHAGMHIALGGTACFTPPPDNQPAGEHGTLTITEINLDLVNNKVLSFAATFVQYCPLAPQPIYGEVRINSGSGFLGPVTDKTSVNIGAVDVGATSAPQSVTVTEQGPLPLTLGAATIIGPDAGVFAVTADGCAGQTLSFGQACTVSFTGAPTALHGFIATLHIPDNTTAGLRSVGLIVSGQSPGRAQLPSSVDFGTVTPGRSATRTVTATVTNASVTFSGSSILENGSHGSVFTITADACAGHTLSQGAQCSITVKAYPTVTGLTIATLYVGNDTPFSLNTNVYINEALAAQGTYYPLPPQRLLDTRTGLGAPRQPIGPGLVRRLVVAGRGGVPATGVAAVVLNVTVTNPTSSGYLSVFPATTPRPTASSLNFTRGATVANLVTVGLGGINGSVDLFNFAGNTDVVADVLGFYAGDDSVLAGHGLGGQYQPLTPTRLLDTRKSAPVAAKHMVTIPVGISVGGTDATSHIRALAVNITAVNPTAAGYLSAWNGQGTHPVSSTLNFTPGVIVPNLAIIPTAPCTATPSCAGQVAIGVYNASPGATHILVDLVGFFDDSQLDGGLRFQPITPTRIVDTRIHQGISHPLGRAQTATITTPSTVGNTTTKALATNVTAVAPTAATYLTIWPTGHARPTASNLNPNAGQTIPNAVLTGLGPLGQFNIYNNDGTTNVCIDVVGTYYPGVVSTSTTPTSQPTLRPNNPTAPTPQLHPGTPTDQIGFD
jgi:hypothetical protein